MDSHHTCVSCRLEDKSVCHSSSTSQYCFDFDLIPHTMTVTGQDGDGTCCNGEGKRTPTGRELHGTTVLEIQYEEDFEADFEAVANNSGYFSNPPFDAHSPDANSADKPSASHPTTKKEPAESRKAPSSHSLFSDTAASVKPDRGSIYDMIDIADVKKRSRSHNYDDVEEDDSPKWPSLFSDAIVAPTPLDLWEQSHHRHESLAYRLELPAKRRRIS